MMKENTQKTQLWNLCFWQNYYYRSWLCSGYTVRLIKWSKSKKTKYVIWAFGDNNDKNQNEITALNWYRRLVMDQKKQCKKKRWGKKDPTLFTRIFPIRSKKDQIFRHGQNTKKFLIIDSLVSKKHRMKKHRRDKKKSNFLKSKRWIYFSY